MKPYLIILGFLTCIMTCPYAVAAPPLLFPDASATVVLDPGHGGQNNGARGPTGLLEKNVCLDIAQKLALRLESRYNVRLTRSDDYDVELHKRSANANQANADLLISLHTGAGFMHATQGLTVFYAQPESSKPNGPTPPDKAEGRDTNALRWDQLQNRHATASKALANRLKLALEAMPHGPDCKVLSAPLAVLQGADTPAVLIEVGHITHPATEKRFTLPQAVDSLVTAIDQGIEGFLTDNPQKK